MSDWKCHCHVVPHTHIWYLENFETMFGGEGNMCKIMLWISLCTMYTTVCVTLKCERYRRASTHLTRLRNPLEKKNPYVAPLDQNYLKKQPLEKF